MDELLGRSRVSCPSLPCQCGGCSRSGVRVQLANLWLFQGLSNEGLMEVIRWMEDTPITRQKLLLWGKSPGKGLKMANFGQLYLGNH